MSKDEVAASQCRISTVGKNDYFPDMLYVMEVDVDASEECETTISAFQTIEDALNRREDVFSGSPYRVGVYKFVEEGKVDVLISINEVNQPE